MKRQEKLEKNKTGRKHQRTWGWINHSLCQREVTRSRALWLWFWLTLSSGVERFNDAAIWLAGGESAACLRKTGGIFKTLRDARSCVCMCVAVLWITIISGPAWLWRCVIWVCGGQGHTSVFRTSLCGDAVVFIVFKLLCYVECLVLCFWCSPLVQNWAKTEETGWPWCVAEPASVIMVIPNPPPSNPAVSSWWHQAYFLYNCPSTDNNTQDNWRNCFFCRNAVWMLSAEWLKKFA